MKHSKKNMFLALMVLTCSATIAKAPTNQAAQTPTGPKNRATTHRGALLRAIKSGDVAELMRIHSENPNIFNWADLTNLHLTPLMYAIYYKYSEIVPTLLKMPQVNQTLNTLRDIYGRTAIFMAVDQDDIKSLKYLINYGASVNVVDKYGKSPLDVARALPESAKNKENIIETLKQTSDHSMGYGPE